MVTSGKNLTEQNQYTICTYTWPIYFIFLPKQNLNKSLDGKESSKVVNIFTKGMTNLVFVLGSKDISPELQAAEVDVIDSQQCDGLLQQSCNRNWCGIQETQLCAGKLAGGVDACQVNLFNKYKNEIKK